MGEQAEVRAGRRRLHLADLDAVLAEAERLAAGPHRTLGRWSLGQILAHLAIFMDKSVEGFGFEMPAALRWLARPMRRRFVRKTWPAGLRIPKRAAATRPPPEVSTEEGLARLRVAAERLNREPARAPSPLLGQLSRREWDQLHCRHAELHLGFVVPGGGG